MPVGQATAFAGTAFCRVWAETFGLRWEALGPDADVGVLFGRSRRLGLRNYALAPRGLYWGASGPDAAAALRLIDRAARHCRGARTVTVAWNFRHDAREQLERARATLGPARCAVTESTTHVLALDGASLEQVLARARPLTRRHLRHPATAALRVRPLESAAEFDRHDAIYLAWARRRGVAAHPPALFRRLATELGPAAHLVGAFAAGELVAAILLFCDAQEWFYWHGVRDAERDRSFAMDALMAWGVDRACRAGARSFNFGASNGIRSLEAFKERWGAAPRPAWNLRWAAPGWSPLLATWRRLRGGAPAGGGDA